MHSVLMASIPLLPNGLILDVFLDVLLLIDTFHVNGTIKGLF